MKPAGVPWPCFFRNLQFQEPPPEKPVEGASFLIYNPFKLSRSKRAKHLKHLSVPCFWNFSHRDDLISALHSTHTHTRLLTCLRSSWASALPQSHWRSFGVPVLLTGQWERWKGSNSSSDSEAHGRVKSDTGTSIFSGKKQLSDSQPKAPKH